jgi:hydrogenase maturation protein HypF
VRGAVEIRVRGRVQGVGFRPTVWRHAQALALDGEVFNDGEGVLVRVAGARSEIEALVEALNREPPPLARIDGIELSEYPQALPSGFRITESVRGAVHTQIAPDAMVCAACAAEIREPQARRHRYPFTNCTHCGPRISIIEEVPYDRAKTTMRVFPMCADCAREYADPADRRFHAEPTACPACGPVARCLDFDGGDLAADRDAVREAASRLAKGSIVAVKGLGGYQLACDATNETAVARLRRRKRRDTKPFALMARDLNIVARYCSISEAERVALCSPAAPIVLLEAKGRETLPENVAPGRDTLGFMLPTTPLHLLLLEDFATPLVMTSGNLTDEPQIVDDGEALARLAEIADCVLLHDRAIANRVDDSVVRMMAERVRPLRRARGYAPEPLVLPPGFENAPDILAMGGELKATFCLIKDGQAILSQHQGDLEHAAAFDEYRKNLALYRGLFDHVPQAVALDRHPEYLCAKLARTLSADTPLIEVQHHHAHAAACLAENNYPRDGKPVLAIVLDGLGFGEDGVWWGGEFLLCDYRNYQRLASLRPVAMPGGAAAIREPWRNLYAHLRAGVGWENFRRDWGALPLAQYLATKPCASLGAMMTTGMNSPGASSCGRLFDAVAAALGISADRQSHEGEAAAALEALANRAGADDAPYSFAAREDSPGLRVLDPAPMWRALLADLAAGTENANIAARFHFGLAGALAQMASTLAGDRGSEPRFTTVALSGGCFQNRLLFETIENLLRARGLEVFAHARVPANDGGISLGQAVVAAARFVSEPRSL